MPDPKFVTDVLLLDYRLPGASATDVLKELCQVRGLDLPIILVTGQGDEEIARQSLKLGAADYVVKSAGYLQRLPTVIENVWLRAESNRRERVLLEERTAPFSCYGSGGDRYMGMEYRYQRDHLG